jgi:hypothetical protein
MKHIPIIGTNKELEENILIAPKNPPSDKEPVSPIKTFAFGVLKIKKPKSAPINDKHKIIKF